MAPIDPALILNGATSQADRAREGPDPASVAVDDRDVAELLAFVGHNASLIRFHDLDGQARGTWAPFFAADPAIFHATHAALDVDEAGRALRHAIGEFRAGRSDAQGLTRLLARWIAIRDRAEAEPLELGHYRGADLDDRDRLADVLDDIGMTVLAYLRQGQAGARDAMEVALKAGGHAPHAALMIAFVALLMEARAALNAFPERLVDFYYTDILRSRPLATAPDRVFLTFTLADPTLSGAVARGARLAAGEDADGVPISYAAETALEVRPTRVIALGIQQTTDDEAVLSDEAISPTGIAPFGMFGDADGNAAGSLVLENATLGFAVTSPTLMLHGGVRQVSIILDLCEDGAVEARWEQAFALFYSTAGGWVAVPEFSVVHAADARRMVVSFELPADAPPLVPTDMAATEARDHDLRADAFPKLRNRPAVVARLRSPAARAALSRVRVTEERGRAACRVGGECGCHSAQGDRPRRWCAGHVVAAGCGGAVHRTCRCAVYRRCRLGPPRTLSAGAIRAA